MSRLRTFAAFTALAAFMCLGIGTATAAENNSGVSDAPHSGMTLAGQGSSNRAAVDLYY